MKVDLLTHNYEKLKNNIILPSYITSKINKVVEPYGDNLTKLMNTKNNFNIYLYRYFTYICPKFIKNTGFINNQRSKLYKKKSDKYFEANVNYNNLIKENINIYAYNSLNYIDDVDSNDNLIIKSINQIEYKHFNNNKVYILPIEITLKPDNIKYVNSIELKNYDNQEKCYEYFKKYVIKNAYNKHLDEQTLIFLFNKYIYTVEKTPSKQYISSRQKLYDIQYKLTLI